MTVMLIGLLIVGALAIGAIGAFFVMNAVIAEAMWRH